MEEMDWWRNIIKAKMRHWKKANLSNGVIVALIEVGNTKNSCVMEIEDGYIYISVFISCDDIRPANPNLTEI